jgi:hypothetical protein
VIFVVYVSLLTPHVGSRIMARSQNPSQYNISKRSGGARAGHFSLSPCFAVLTDFFQQLIWMNVEEGLEKRRGKERLGKSVSPAAWSKQSARL